MKLLVVDDDRYTREGILSCLPLEELGIQHVMQTHDGKTALEIVRWFSPNIIITDICMPRMDGIAFASAVRKLQPECLLIFITGFAEIDYLKKAIELSAVAFVEKPLQPDELLAAVRHAIEKHQEYLHVHQYSESLMKLRRQQAASMMMRVDKNVPELISLCEKISFPVHAAYRCVVLRHLQQNARDMMEILEHTAAENQWDCVAELREEHVVHAVLAGKKHHEKEWGTLFASLLKKIPGLMLSEGMTVSAIDRIHESRKAACLMMEGSFYDTQRQLFLYEPRKADGILSVDDYAQFVRLMDEDSAQLPVWLSNLMEHVLERHSDRVESVRSLVLSILREIYRRKPELYGKVYGISQSSELEDYVASVSSLQEFIDMFHTLFEQMNALEDANTRFAQVVRNVKLYIAQHFHEPDMGLADIAAHVNFSAAYLNVAFRQETGKTIKQYLIECRMNEAKRLLADPSVRISEIAARCGYSNSNYFAKAFKEMTGLTPGEYRERKA